jgi:hypothetical protein
MDLQPFTSIILWQRDKKDKLRSNLLHRTQKPILLKGNMMKSYKDQLELVPPSAIYVRTPLVSSSSED